MSAYHKDGKASFGYKDKDVFLCGGLLYRYNRKKRFFRLVPTRFSTRLSVVPQIIFQQSGSTLWSAGGIVSGCPRMVVERILRGFSDHLFNRLPEKEAYTNSFIESVKEGKYASRVHAQRAIGVASRHGVFKTPEDRRRTEEFVEKFSEFSSPDTSLSPKRKRALNRSLHHIREVLKDPAASRELRAGLLELLKKE